MASTLDKHATSRTGGGLVAKPSKALNVANHVLRSVVGIHVLTVALVAFVFAAVPQEASARSSVHHLQTNGNLIRVNVTIHKSETVQVDNAFAEVLVGNPDIADVMPLTDRSIYILGKKIGTTRLSILDTGKRILGIVEVEVTHDLKNLEARLSTHVPNSNIQVSSVNGNVLLSGTVPDAIALEKAMSLARQVAPKAVTNTLSVASPQQVLLEVRFVEADRKSARDLGIGWNVIGNHVIALSQVSGLAPGPIALGGTATRVLGAGAGLASNNVPFGAAIARLLDNGVKADVIVQALEKRGLARRLAEPNLVALSGDTASFLAGGEFPFPVQSDRDRISVEFKKFGIGLAFTPTVLAEGLINLKIEPEVSELDPTNTLRVGGIEIPSLVVRRAQTTVELRDGQSFAIAGLLKSNHTKAQRQLPWVGQVPVLGTLFRSASFQKSETDLVIIVTPRLVKPKVPGEKLITPLDKSIASNDIDFFLRGKQEIHVKAPVPGSGHILELKAEAPISGTKGKTNDYK